MIKKGHISVIDNITKKASVTFDDMDNTVSSMLPIMYQTIKDAKITGDYTITLNDGDITVSGNSPISGTLNIEYFPDYKEHDFVIVCFFDAGLTDGVILGKIGDGS